MVSPRWGGARQGHTVALNPESESLGKDETETQVLCWVTRKGDSHTPTSVVPEFLEAAKAESGTQESVKSPSVTGAYQLRIFGPQLGDERLA